MIELFFFIGGDVAIERAVQNSLNLTQLATTQIVSYDRRKSVRVDISTGDRIPVTSLRVTGERIRTRLLEVR